ncbi:hypothetical protein VTP01DRAFT_10047 [Rhizomucor pusillus]|uniref:uncharacterized protein n=1 Tax=Rhizomucor pusillus TaxID=4840 RepID=UPI003743ACB3
MASQPGSPFLIRTLLARCHRRQRFKQQQKLPPVQAQDLLAERLQRLHIGGSTQHRRSLHRPIQSIDRERRGDGRKDGYNFRLILTGT